ncbi:MAG: hypothetical protein ACRDWH_04860 [Acidimicrobiia bacterium]
MLDSLRRWQPAVSLGPLATAALIAGWISWGVVLLLCVSLVFVGFGILLDQARLGVVHGEGMFSISPDIARTLSEAGIPERVLANLAFGTRLGGWLVFAVTGLVIFLLKPRDWAALVTSIMLMAVGSALLVPLALVGVRRPELSPAVMFIGHATDPWSHFGRSVAGVSSLTAMLILPDGRFVPRWTRWFLGAVLGVVALWTFVPNSIFNLEALTQPAQQLWIGGVPLVGVLAQAYRYARVSSRDERRKTHTVIAAVAAGTAAFLALVVFDPELGAGIFDLGLVTPEVVAFYEIILLLLLGAAVLFLPLSIAWSVLRYQLFDVRLFVNRALVYTALTAVLIGVGLAAVFVTSRTLGLLLGEVIASDVALVGSTVTITLLFGPARRWVQDLIDRAFYRSRYDAARIMEDFGQRVGGDGSLESVAAELVSTVDEAMRPRSVRVWLRTKTDGADSSERQAHHHHPGEYRP